MFLAEQAGDGPFLIAQGIIPGLTADGYPPAVRMEIVTMTAFSPAIDKPGLLKSGHKFTELDGRR